MNETTSRLPVTTQLADLVTAFVTDTNEAAASLASGKPRGAITGLSKLDEFFGGYLAPGIHVVQAAPGCGKTAFALQMASDCYYPALFVSAEMGLLPLFRRLIARSTGTFLGRLKSGEICGLEANRLALLTAQKLPQLALMDAATAYASPEIIINVANGLRERFQTNQVLIVLDSLHVWARSAQGASPELGEVDEYSLINASLKAISEVTHALQCPVVTIAHRNRAGNKSDGGLHAAKGSGGIEYEAQSVLDLNKENAAENAQGETIIKASLQKNRDGVSGVFVNLSFHGALQSFREAE